MSEQSDVPVLTDLIEKGMEITLSDLGLDDDLEIKTDTAGIDSPDIDTDDTDIDDLEIRTDSAGIDDLEIEADDTDIDVIVVDEAAPDLGAINPFEDNPALEYAIYRILEEHMELAWQEIKVAIQRDLKKP